MTRPGDIVTEPQAGLLYVDLTAAADQWAMPIYRCVEGTWERNTGWEEWDAPSGELLQLMAGPTLVLPAGEPTGVGAVVREAASGVAWVRHQDGRWRSDAFPGETRCWEDMAYPVVLSPGVNLA